MGPFAGRSIDDLEDAVRFRPVPCMNWSVLPHFLGTTCAVFGNTESMGCTRGLMCACAPWINMWLGLMSDIRDVVHPHVLPIEKYMTSSRFEKIIGTTNGWLRQKVH